MRFNKLHTIKVVIISFLCAISSFTSRCQTLDDIFSVHLQGQNQLMEDYQAAMTAAFDNDWIAYIRSRNKVIKYRDEYTVAGTAEYNILNLLVSTIYEAKGKVHTFPSTLNTEYSCADVMP